MELPKSLLTRKLKILACEDCKSFDPRGVKSYCYFKKKLTNPKEVACKNLKAK